MARMRKRWVGSFWVAVAISSCLVSSAFAQTPVEVCWKPPDLPPNVNTFAVVVDKANKSLVLLDADKFWDEAKHRVVLRYNPNLGPESLARIPSVARPPG